PAGRSQPTSFSTSTTSSAGWTGGSPSGTPPPGRHSATPASVTPPTPNGERSTSQNWSRSPSTTCGWSSETCTGTQSPPARPTFLAPMPPSHLPDPWRSLPLARHPNPDSNRRQPARVRPPLPATTASNRQPGGVVINLPARSLTGPAPMPCRNRAWSQATHHPVALGLACPDRPPGPPAAAGHLQGKGSDPHKAEVEVQPSWPTRLPSPLGDPQPTRACADCHLPSTDHDRRDLGQSHCSRVRWQGGGRRVTRG